MSAVTVDIGYIKEAIDSVRESIGRVVTLYYSKLETCTICVASGYYDPISDTSWYTICPQCKGLYWLNTVIARDVVARVHWVGNEGITATPGGKYYLGDAQITVDPSERVWLSKTQDDAGKVVVDGQDFTITKIHPMGTPTVNRVRAVLKAMGDNKLIP